MGHTCAPYWHCRIGGVCLKPKCFNAGHSCGLGYAYIFGKIHDRWFVWNRHNGRVVFVADERISSPEQYDLFNLHAAQEACLRWIGAKGVADRAPVPARPPS
jgi:hypothetical protein